PDAPYLRSRSGRSSRTRPRHPQVPSTTSGPRAERIGRAMMFLLAATAHADCTTSTPTWALAMPPRATEVPTNAELYALFLGAWPADRLASRLLHTRLVWPVGTQLPVTPSPPAAAAAYTPVLPPGPHS